jgi:BAAT/acyl-coA thioester hydrolase C-terminal domain protein
MMRIKVILLYILIITIAMTMLVFTLRFYNDYKYGKDSLTSAEYYNDVTNLSLYPKKINGVEVRVIDEDTFQGFHLIPEKKTHKGVVVCYGGSEGSPNFEEAQRLAKEGYETLAVFMFGMKNQQKTLVKIPLEQFEDVLKYVNKNIEGKTPITVLAASKGAEYALNLATKYDEISNLVLIAPSAYTFAGLDFDNYGSSWTWKGKEIEYVDIKNSSFLTFIKNIIVPIIIKSPVQYKAIYDNAAEQDLERTRKLIPAQNIKANILMIVGEDDQMWGSYEMAKIIQSYNKNAIISSHKNAGHIFEGNGVLNTPNMRIRLGGTSDGNKKAKLEEEKVINNFLNQYH